MTLQFDIREFDEVASTNDVVKQLAFEGEPEGVVVCARTQTAGYGRRGNAWKSQPGSLYMSLLLRPESEMAQVQTLPLVVALAVRRALVSLLPDSAGDTIQVKWPNDVVTTASRWAMCQRVRPFGTWPTFNKLCGISCELKHGAICVGIGVNVRDAEGDSEGEASVESAVAASDASRNRPTYLSELFDATGHGEHPERCPSVEQVRDAVLVQFAAIYERWQAFGFAPFRAEYARHAALLGSTVRVEDALAFVGEQATPTREVPCCVIEGIDDEGRLVASACETGEAVKVTAGRVEVLHDR